MDSPDTSESWLSGGMHDIERILPADRRGLELLYRRTFGHEADEAIRLRWDWLRRNPCSRHAQPLCWVAREGPTVVASSLLMPVRVALRGLETDGAWGSDPVVIPERQRRGLGEALLRHWDRTNGVALGAALSTGTRFLLRDRIRWPEPLAMSCLVKPLSRRAFRRPTWPMVANRAVSALTLPLVRIAGRAHPLREHVEPVRRFDETVDRLWERVSARLDLAVTRGAAYLNWKYVEPPHVRYSIAVLRRDGEVHGYVVFRHVHEPQGRVTLIVDVLTDPSDERGFKTLLSWVDREARAENADKVRCYIQHAGFRRMLRRSGYFVARTTIPLNVKVNAVSVPQGFYRDSSRWHFTWGDGMLDH